MLLFLDSVGHYDTSGITEKYTQLAGTSTYGSVTVAQVNRRGGINNALRVLSSFDGHSTFTRLVPSAPAPAGDTWIHGMAFRAVTRFSTLSVAGTNDENTTNQLAAVRWGGVTQVWFRLNTNGTISALCGATLLGTTGIALLQNVYSYLEFKVKIAASGGTVEVRIDGLPSLVVTANTQGAGSVTWDEWSGPYLRAGGSSDDEWNYHDIYLADGTGSDGWTNFMGDVRIDAAVPNGVGTHSEFTRSGGLDQFATIDDAQANGDIDYNSTGSVGAKDTLNFPNLPTTGAAIKGLQVVIQARKTDGGSATNKALARISGVDYEGAERAIPATYGFLRQPWGVKPSDGVAWSESDYNAAEFGYKKQA